jgi:micrococcal nuclease
MNQRVIFFFICLLISLSIASASNEPEKNYPSSVKVTKVVDGDTFWGIDAKNKSHKVRLIGIDAPESRKTGNKPIGFYGKEASDYMRQLLIDQNVKLEYDKQKTDRYGRLLAYVYLSNGTFVNNHLVNQGFANAIYYKPNNKHTQQLTQSCNEAKKLRKGMWSKP